MQDSTTEVVSIASNAVESIQRAEVDVQISTARKYPRQLPAVKQKMLAFATLDQETAESCFYSLPRGGKNIVGPSVRLAEIAVACYGNLRAGSRIIESVTDGPNPHVVVQAVAHDLESNTAITVEKRRRITKKKAKDKIDEDDINLACNAGAAIAFRDAVFKIVPGALIKPVFEQARQVAIGDAKSLVDRRARAFESFAKMGVQQDKVLSVLGKTHMDLVDLEDLGTLFGLHTAIKEGDMTIDEAFPSPEVKRPDMAGAAKDAKEAKDKEAKEKEDKAKEPPKEPEKTPENVVQMPAKYKEAAGYAGEADSIAAAAAKSKAPEPPKEKIAEPAKTPEPTPSAKAPDVAENHKTDEISDARSVVKAILESKKVDESDFLDWLVGSGRCADAVKLGFAGAPEVLMEKLAADTTALSKCIKLYGKA